jgi:gas vesicle protein
MAQGKDQLGDRAQPGSQQARANIDVTRQAMDRTIEAIEGKLTPGQLLLEGLDLLGRGGTTGANKLVELARDHPVPAAVIGVGVGMMIRDASQKKTARPSPGPYASGYGYEGGYPYEASPRAYDEGPGAASRAVHTAKERVTDVAQTAKETVAGAAQEARETVGEVAHTARERVSGVVETAREKAASLEEEAARVKERARVRVRDAKIGFWQTLDEKPLVVGAAAIAVGLVAGLLIPTTERENEVLGDKRDEMLRRAQEKGREVVTKGKHVAQVAVETLKTEVHQQGLTPADIAEKVRTVARDAVEKAREEAQREGLIPGSSESNPSPSGEGVNQ